MRSLGVKQYRIIGDQGMLCARKIWPLIFSMWRGRSIFVWRSLLSYKQKLLTLLDDVLNLQGRAQQIDLDTPLLGALPELDSMAVVGVITALEEHFQIMIADDEIDGSTFETVGSLLTAVESLVSRAQKK